MPNFEAAERRRIGQGRFVVLLNVSAQFALENRLEKGAHFVVLPGRLQFHAAILILGNLFHNLRT